MTDSSAHMRVIEETPAYWIDRADTFVSARCSRVAATIPQAKPVITIVRIAVARLDGMPSTPTFARIAVSAAAIAEIDA